MGRFWNNFQIIDFQHSLTAPSLSAKIYGMRHSLLILLILSVWSARSWAKKSASDLNQSKLPGATSVKDYGKVSFPLGTVQCAGQVMQALDKWKSLDDWRPSAPTADGSFVMSTPTKNFGTWIEVLWAPVGGRVSLRLLKTESIVTVLFNPDEGCKASLGVETGLQDPRFEAGYWSDYRIQSLLKQNKKGLIYVWSPHMPYSWEGLREIQVLKKKYPKIRVDVVLDPDSEMAAARRVVKRFRWPKEYLRKSQSTEFLMRGYFLHAPTLIPYRQGEFANHMPGYRPADKMATFLKQEGVL